MLAHKRLSDEFETIRSSSYTPAKKLASLNGVTERTVRNDIAKINETLAECGAHIEMRRGMGYHLVVDDANAFQLFLVNQESPKTSSPDLSSTDDRIRYLLCTLLTSEGYRSAAELAEMVFVGENTMQNYLHQLRMILEAYDLALMNRHGVGMKIFGRESDRRRCFMEKVIVRDTRSYVTGFSMTERALFPTVNLNKLEEIVHRRLVRSKVVTSDYGLKNLLMHMALMIERIQAGASIEGGETPDIAPRFQTQIDDVCAEIEEAFSVRISEAERSYLYRHVLLNIKLDTTDAADGLFFDEIDQMLEGIYTDYGFDLRDDAELKRNLLTHLTSLFANGAIGGSRKNPLLGTIRTNFPLAFEVALTSTHKVFDQEPYILNEDEVGYVALHLGAAMERRTPAAGRRQRVLVVCGNGMSIAQMLKSRVETLFSDQLEIARTLTYREFLELGREELEGISFAISTVPLEGSHLPWVLVDFSLNAHDTEAISRLLSGSGDEDERGIGAFFSPELFERLGVKTSKEEVIELLCERLQAAGVVGEGFYEQVLKREGISDTSMTKYFAIPHPLKPASTTTNVAVAVLDEGICWSESAKDVRIVFLLAVQPGDHNDIERLYDLLIDVTNDRGLQHAIMGAKSFDEFMATL